MSNKKIPKLEIIVPFHNENFKCIDNLQPPSKLNEIMRTIFIYDGKLSNNKAIKEIKNHLGSTNII